MDDTLLDALDRLKGTGAEFHGFLANHGPMAAEALIRLGASEEVPGWVDRYRTVLDDAPVARGHIAAEDWRDHVGDVRLLAEWTQLMRREVADGPWREVLVRWWPRLLPGMAASATHGVIRTAHAVRSARLAGDGVPDGILDELAQGLAFWAARYQPLPGDPGLSGGLSAVDAVAALPRLDPDEPAAGPGIAGRLVSLIRLRPLPDALDRWGAPAGVDEALDALIAAAARVLVARDDTPIAFCHAVTAPAAVRLVAPELPASLQAATVAASWQVVGSIVAAFAAPRLPSESDPAHVDPEPLLATLTADAVAHGDEHVIKLTEAALREYARTEDATLLLAARRFRERISPRD